MGASGVERYVREMYYSVRLDVDLGRLDPIWMLTDADAEQLLADLGGSEAGNSTLEPRLQLRERSDHEHPCVAYPRERSAVSNPAVQPSRRGCAT